MNDKFEERYLKNIKLVSPSRVIDESIRSPLTDSTDESPLPPSIVEVHGS